MKMDQDKNENGWMTTICLCLSWPKKLEGWLEDKVKGKPEIVFSRGKEGEIRSA